jgi:acyl-CoA reductase-like NAD-dependent aldehyde dehydrogenase
MRFVAVLAILVGLAAIAAGCIVILKPKKNRSLSLLVPLLGLIAAALALWLVNTKH